MMSEIVTHELKGCGNDNWCAIIYDAEIKYACHWTVVPKNDPNWPRCAEDTG